MPLTAEVIVSLQLLLYPNLLQISIRQRPQPDPCDLLCW